MRFQPGESGNPNGRPRKKWALTEILKTKGGKIVPYFDRRVSGKHLIAELLWQFATTGRVRFPDGHELSTESVDEWLRVVQYIYTRVDGPPQQTMDVTSGGGSVKFVTVIAPVDESDE